MLNQGKGKNVILKDVHCPYCNSDKATLISTVVSKKFAFQLPAYGLKFVLSLLYLSFVQIWVNGFKFFEAIKTVDTVTYAFCPICGNSYSMAAPDTIKDEMSAPKFYRINSGKCIMGICTGISEYTGISLLWVRIMTVLYALTGIVPVLYFLVGACIPYKETAEKEPNKKRFYRYRKGKDFFGICKGFAEYTDIPVMWVRLLFVLFGASVIGTIAYLIIPMFVPYKEDVDAGIKRKKLHKVKEGKWIFGVCTGIAKRTKMPLWLVRLLTVILGVPLALYPIFTALLPHEEDLDPAEI